MQRYPIFFWIIGIVTVALTNTQCSRRVVEEPHHAQMVRKAHAMALLCRVYALDHGGKPPAKLSDLIGHEGITPEKWDELCFRDRRSGERMDWLYFPIAYSYISGGAELLIASPVPVSEKGLRIAVFADNSARMVKSEEFEKLERKALRRIHPPVPD